jgi:hypothetical protein
MKSPGGYIQGYNAQAAVNEGLVVVACTVTQEANDPHQLLPMMAATQATLGAAAAEGEIGLVLADAGSWSEDNATAEGPDRLIATTKDWQQRRAARELGVTSGLPPAGATPLLAMEHRLRIQAGAEAYAERSCTVEPVFGDCKENRAFRGFMRQSLPFAVSGPSSTPPTASSSPTATQAGAGPPPGRHRPPPEPPAGGLTLLEPHPLKTCTAPRWTPPSALHRPIGGLQATHRLPHTVLAAFFDSLLGGHPGRRITGRGVSLVAAQPTRQAYIGADRTVAAS